MANVRIKILRTCAGRGGVRMQPGTVWTMRRPAAEAMVRVGNAMLLHEQPIPETKAGPPPAAAAEEPDLWDCAYCDRQYKTERGLEGHIAREHGEDE